MTHHAQHAGLESLAHNSVNLIECGQRAREMDGVGFLRPYKGPLGEGDT